GDLLHFFFGFGSKAVCQCILVSLCQCIGTWDLMLLSPKLWGDDRQNYSSSLASILASSANFRQNDLVIGNEVGCRYVFAAFPVYEILTVAYLARRLLFFFMQ